MDKFLAGWEKTKKKKHRQAYYDQRRHFYSFVLSVDGILGKESLLVLTILSIIVAAKMDEHILHVTG